MIITKTGVNNYLNHGLSNPLVQLYMNRGGKTKIMELPICPKCERIGLRDKGWVTHKIMRCPHCGYNGKATCKFSAYLKEGCYK